MSQLFDFLEIPVDEVQQGYLLVLSLDGRTTLFRVSGITDSVRRQDDGTYRRTRTLTSEPRPDTGQPMTVQWASGEMVMQMMQMAAADAGVVPWPTEDVLPSSLQVGDVVKFPEADRWLQITQRHDVPDSVHSWDRQFGKRFFFLAPIDQSPGRLAIAYDHLDGDSTVLRRSDS